MIGKILKYMRISSNLSQDDIAKKLSVNQTTISGWERGYREPTFEIIEKIANICNYNINFTNKKNEDTINSQNIYRKI